MDLEARPLLVFVTPAWRRYEMTRLCLGQRRWACEKLSALGVRATSVIVADDENLDIAEELGFHHVVRKNDYLGAKFNDGYEFACRNLGADYVVPMGSDSWVDPTFIVNRLPRKERRTLVYSRHYAMIRQDGRQRAHLFVEYKGGVTMCFPAQMLRNVGYRPCRENLPRGCDTSTLRTLRENGGVVFRISEVHDLETMTFRSEQQISDYDVLFKHWGTGVASDPWEGIADFYPPELVAKAKRFYGVA